MKVNGTIYLLGYEFENEECDLIATVCDFNEDRNGISMSLALSDFAEEFPYVVDHDVIMDMFFEKLCLLAEMNGYELIHSGEFVKAVMCPNCDCGGFMLNFVGYGDYKRLLKK